jgi:hypothetical protein
VAEGCAWVNPAGAKCMFQPLCFLMSLGSEMTKGYEDPCHILKKSPDTTHTVIRNLLIYSACSMHVCKHVCLWRCKWKDIPEAGNC